MKYEIEFGDLLKPFTDRGVKPVRFDCPRKGDLFMAGPNHITTCDCHFTVSEPALIFAHNPKESDGQTTRPPLGIMPKVVWLESRRNDLLAAMKRHTEAGLVISDAWIDELVECQRAIKQAGGR